MTPVEFRRHLHAYPELSFGEEQTARFIAEQLTALGIEHRSIARTGVLARIVGGGDTRRAVVLRADIDALPIHEAVDVAWRSRNEGVMHACGHDVHAAVLFGVLKRLKEEGGFDGTVFGLFQPGEECVPGGASLVLAEKPFDGYDVIAMIGEHVEPRLEVGTFGFRAGKYMASNDELHITVHGKGGHAAMREQIKDPVTAAADMTLQLTAMNSADSVVSIGRFIADGATNVIPDTVAMQGTMRTFDESLREQIKRNIHEAAAATGAKYGVTIDADIRHGYPCVVNDPQLTTTARTLAAGNYRTVELPLRTTAEDFGFYCSVYPSLFYRLGTGGTGATHTPLFNPDERAIGYGIEFMNKLTRTILENGKEKREDNIR